MSIPGLETRARRTKILATLGPASENPEMIAKLFEAGADVFRLNMSHLPREKLKERVAMIRAAEARFRRPIAILADLQGPKLRVGAFEGDSAMLVPGQSFTLDADMSPGTTDRVHLPHPEILSSLEPGHTVLIDDGKLRLRVKSVKQGSATTAVEVAGKISNRKGVSLPDTTIPVAAMTDKDRSDLEAALDAGVDWIALSFVQRPEDVAEVKKVARGRALVMAKLEKPPGHHPPGGDHGDLRRRHGGPRRSRCRDAPGKGARHPEAHRPHGAPLRQARGGGDPDARVHDHLPGAHPRRGLRRGDRRL